MSLLPPRQPQGFGVDAPKGEPGGRHRLLLPRHRTPRRLGVGGTIGVVAAIVVVVLGLVAGGVSLWQAKVHADALDGYRAALSSWQDAKDAAAAAQHTIDTASTSLATAREGGSTILAAAADGFVGKDQKAALTAAIAAEPAADTKTPGAPGSGGATPSPTAPAASATGGATVIADVSRASTDELNAAAAALTTAKDAVQTAAAPLAAKAAAVQQTEASIETSIEALLRSADQQGRAWLDAFIGKDAPAGKQLAAALTALEQATPQTADRAGLLGKYVTAAGPAVPGALTDPNSIYVIVDKLRPINDPTEQNEPARHWAPSGLVPVGGGQVLRSVAATALKDLMAGARAAGYSVPALSCYRSWANQNATYAHWVAADGSTTTADSHSARPGYSEHQTGLACDIGGGTQAWGATAAGKWTAAHAADYGFILRYDQGKQDLSGYVYEPWHFRYVGVPVAQAIYAAGNPTLEQWMGLPAPKTYSDGSGNPDTATWNG